jgi:hypothetical protein
MCYTRTMLQVLRHMGYGVVGALHSFETESSQNFLFSGADNHKAMEFLMYFVCSITLTLTSQPYYTHTHPHTRIYISQFVTR